MPGTAEIRGRQQRFASDPAERQEWAASNDNWGQISSARMRPPNRSAIRRSERLDRTIHLVLPDTEALLGIPRFYLSDDLADADRAPAALACRGGSGADVEGWVRRAKPEVAARRGTARSGPGCSHWIGIAWWGERMGRPV